jgi:uncharacterized membrane protein
MIKNIRYWLYPILIMGFKLPNQVVIKPVQNKNILMLVTIEASQIIDRPIATVFEFCAYNHVKNHPRWDPDMQLEQISNSPIGVGTVIRRKNSHSGTVVEGTMEVVEFKPNQSLRVLIHEGSVETRGSMEFESITKDQTKVTLSVEIPGMDSSMDTSFLKSLMVRSCLNIKKLIESETKK